MRHGQAPKRLILIEEAQSMFVEIRPVRRVQQLAAQSVMSRRHRAFATFQPQVQALTVVARGADRQRLLAPFREAQQGAFAVHFQADAQGLSRFGQDLERDFGDHAKRAVAAGHQARQVVAGDVFHDFATEAQMLAVPGDDPCSEDEVADRARPRTSWPRQPAGDHAADGGVVTEGGRFAGQHLLRRVQHFASSANGVPQRAVITSSVGS